MAEAATTEPKTHAAKAEETSEVWYATDTIYFGGARAYNVGDIVPPTNVAAHGYDKDKLVSHDNPLA